MAIRVAVGEHQVVKTALPAILGVLFAAAFLLVGFGVIIDRGMGGCALKLAMRVAPGSQAAQELDFAIAEYARSAEVAAHGGDPRQLVDAADRLQHAAERYDGYVKAAQIDGAAPEMPAVRRVEASITPLSVVGMSDAQILDGIDPLTSRVRHNNGLATHDAVHELDTFAHLAAARRWIEIAVLLLLAAGCTLLLLAAWRREARTSADEAEMARRLEQANADLEAFAGRIAHDLRNPLLPILSGSQVIEHAAEMSPRVRQAAERIERSARRLSGMIDMLLTFSRLTHASQPAESDLAGVVEEVMETFRERATAERVRLEIDCCPGARVACEPIVLSSALQNLVENAFKYGRKPGDPEGVIVVRGYVEGDCVVVEVEDHGPGLTTQQAETLFQPFRRGDQRGDGVGLGLATARRLVEARGGSIGLRTGAVGGALFVIRLPTAPPHADDARASAGAGPGL